MDWVVQEGKRRRPPLVRRKHPGLPALEERANSLPEQEVRRMHVPRVLQYDGWSVDCDNQLYHCLAVYV